MSHLIAAKRPMSEARRQHLHGRLEPMPSEDRQWMPYSWWALIGLLGAALLIAAMPEPGQDTPTNTQGERT